MNITPKALEAAKKNPSLMMRIKSEHAKAGQAASEDQTVIPMLRNGEFVPTPEVIADPTTMDKAGKLVMARKAVDDLMVQQGIENPIIRQIFVDDFATGNFYESLSTRLALAGQFIPEGLASLAILPYHATGAYRFKK